MKTPAARPSFCVRRRCRANIVRHVQDSFARCLPLPAGKNGCSRTALYGGPALKADLDQAIQ